MSLAHGGPGLAPGRPACAGGCGMSLEAVARAPLYEDWRPDQRAPFSSSAADSWEWPAEGRRAQLAALLALPATRGKPCGAVPKEG